jgi:hypothetical protein
VNAIELALWIADALTSGDERKLRDGVSLVDALSREGKAEEGTEGSNQIARLVIRLRGDGWTTFDYDQWPGDPDPPPGAAFSYQHLQRCKEIRLTPEGWEAVPALRAELGAPHPQPSEVNEGGPTRDVFLCHAGEDKDAIARPLAERLRQKQWQVWFDEFELTVGDSLRHKIDEGLTISKYGVVILSRAFFGKGWPERELNGLTARETATGDKVILPIWHDVTSGDIAGYSLPLANKIGIPSHLGIEHVIEELERVLRSGSIVNVRPGLPAAPPQVPLPAQSMRAGQDPVELIRSEQGQERVHLGLDHEEIDLFVEAGGRATGPAWMTLIIGPNPLQEDLFDPTLVSVDEVAELQVAESWWDPRPLSRAGLRPTIRGFTTIIPPRDDGPPEYVIQLASDGLMEFSWSLELAPKRDYFGRPKLIPTLGVAERAHDLSLYFLEALDHVGYEGAVSAQIIFSAMKGQKLGIERGRDLPKLPIEEEQIWSPPLRGSVAEARAGLNRWLKRTMDRLFLAGGITTGAYFLDESGRLAAS